jgi:hypothetical protein
MSAADVYFRPQSDLRLACKIKRFNRIVDVANEDCRTDPGFEKLNAEKTRMSEPDGRARQVIPQELMLSRLAQSDQMREFFIQMWLQNPALARQGGARVQSLLAPLGHATHRT